MLKDTLLKDLSRTCGQRQKPHTPAAEPMGGHRSKCLISALLPPPISEPEPSTSRPSHSQCPITALHMSARSPIGPRPAQKEKHFSKGPHCHLRPDQRGCSRGAHGAGSRQDQISTLVKQAVVIHRKMCLYELEVGAGTQWENTVSEGSFFFQSEFKL